MKKNPHSNKKTKQPPFVRRIRLSMPDYVDGLTDAYIELLECGIRDVCMPSVGDPDFIDNKKYAPLGLSYYDLVDKKARAHGFGVLPILDKKPWIKGASNRFATIIYKKSAKHKALMLKRLFLKDRGTAEDQRKIGRLFGYGEKEIEEFVRNR